MAPVLQCPDCGSKHPLDRVPAQGAFPCQGCGRVLKVPEVVGQRAAAAAAAAGGQPAPPAVVPQPAPGTAAAASAAPARPVPVATAVVGPNGPAADPMATRTVPGSGVDEQARAEALGALGGRGRPARRLGHVPWWMRLLVWIVAVPVGFLFVFLVARAFGLFTSNDLSDLFLANNTGRFWPAARLLPFVALVTALIVQFGVYLLARLRGRKAGAGAPVELSASAGRARA